MPTKSGQSILVIELALPTISLNDTECLMFGVASEPKKPPFLAVFL